MTIRAPVLVWAVLLLALALACGREEATQAEGGASDVAAGTAAAPGEATPDVAAAGDAGGAVARPGAAARCRDFAARGAWAEALKPCTKAHAKNPEDAEIEGLLQQARAAAEAGAP